MNRIQLEHIIRAASQISDDTEIVIIGSQAIHAQDMKLPPVAFQSAEADVYPRNHPERADDIDPAIGELSPFHKTHGYYAHGVSPRPPFFPPAGKNASFASATRTRAARSGFVSTFTTSFCRNMRRGVSRIGISIRLSFAPNSLAAVN